MRWCYAGKVFFSLLLEQHECECCKKVRSVLRLYIMGNSHPNIHIESYLCDDCIPDMTMNLPGFYKKHSK